MFLDCWAEVLKESNLEDATMLQVRGPLRTSYFGPLTVAVGRKCVGPRLHLGKRSQI